MRRRRDTTDDDDARDVARDGEVVRLPLWLMDSRQRAIRDGLGRPAAQTFDARGHRPGYVRVSSPAIADARREAREARRAWIEDMTTAWRRTPHKDAGEPDAAAALKRHLCSEPDDDAQVRRDRAWKSYCDQLSTAWQTSPRAATAIERQGEQWRGGR